MRKNFIWLSLLIFIASGFFASCKGRAAQQKISKTKSFTIQDWKKQLLKEIPQAGENPPPGTTPLEVELSTHPYFIVYANMNNNGKPDAVFVETEVGITERAYGEGPELKTRRLLIYEWNGEKWVILFIADLKNGVATPKKQWLVPNKSQEGWYDLEKGWMPKEAFYHPFFYMHDNEQCPGIKLGNPMEHGDGEVGDGEDPDVYWSGSQEYKITNFPGDCSASEECAKDMIAAQNDLAFECRGAGWKPLTFTPP